MHLLSLQEARGATGSLEQPPGCASWKLGRKRDFREAYPSWIFCKFVVCAYGMKNPRKGESWAKMQGVRPDASLAEMHHPCVCTVEHTHAQGLINGGPRRGVRCSRVVGECALAMCSALATFVQRVVRGQ